jgi:hypothetical protein
MYTIGTCKTTTPLTVLALPAYITGTPKVCEGATTALNNSTPGGTWSSSTPAVGSVSSTGVVSGLVAGTTTISYTGTNTCSRTATISVNALPTITGSLGICSGTTSSLSGGMSGSWTSSNTGVATFVAVGVAKGMSAGTSNITFTSGGGCVATAQVTVVVCPRGMNANAAGGADDNINIALYPNPTTGSFTISTPEAGSLAIYTIDGREVARFEVAIGATDMALPETLTPGIYTCRFNGVMGATMNVRLVYTGK